MSFAYCARLTPTVIRGTQAKHTNHLTFVRPDAGDVVAVTVKSNSALREIAASHRAPWLQTDRQTGALESTLKIFIDLNDHSPVVLPMHHPQLPASPFDYFQTSRIFRTVWQPAKASKCAWQIFARTFARSHDRLLDGWVFRLPRDVLGADGSRCAGRLGGQHIGRCVPRGTLQTWRNGHTEN